VGNLLEADDYKVAATKVTSDGPTEETTAVRIELKMGIASVGEGRGERSNDEARED
jgi:hypothetical protein